jgi:NitT/TauT family transport system ATP-binding protein
MGRLTRPSPPGQDVPPPEFGIELANLSFGYRLRDGSRLGALDGVDLHCRPGEFVSIVGPSGCGKSTLLRLVAGLLRSTAGEVRVDGVSVTRPTGNVSMVFQKPVLLPWRTVLENCLLPIHLNRSSVKRHRERALELLQLVGLTNFASRYPAELSGGMQQRAAIARALLTNPRYLLMDEPFGALDALTRDQMAVELQAIWLQTKATVLFVTHSISEAVLLSDRVASMSARPGRVLEVVKIGFPRPRELSVMRDPRFGELVDHLRSQLQFG